MDQSIQMRPETQSSHRPEHSEPPDSDAERTYLEPMTSTTGTLPQDIEARARIRSAATLEPFETSIAHLDTLSDLSPAVAEPSATQEFLEGIIAGHLRHLYDPFRERRRYSRFEVTRIHAGQNHLELEVRGAELDGVLHLLLPAWTPGERTLEHGISGLRYRASERGDGVSFYLQGQEGLVTFTGISITAFEHFRQRELAESGLQSVTTGEPLRDAETRNQFWANHNWGAASIIIRRLGLLMSPAIAAIDSWWGDDGTFNVELIPSTPDSDDFPLGILSQLLSPHLSPRLHLARSAGDHRYLWIDDSNPVIDIRILRTAPSPVSA